MIPTRSQLRLLPCCEALNGPVSGCETMFVGCDYSAGNADDANKKRCVVYDSNQLKIEAQPLPQSLQVVSLNPEQPTRRR